MIEYILRYSVSTPENERKITRMVVIANEAVQYTVSAELFTTTMRSCMVWERCLHAGQHSNRDALQSLTSLIGPADVDERFHI